MCVRQCVCETVCVCASDSVCVCCYRECETPIVLRCGGSGSVVRGVAMATRRALGELSEGFNESQLQVKTRPSDTHCRVTAV